MKSNINKFFTAALIVAAVLLASPLKAQVTIGAKTPPQSFSLLELVAANRGLRLPQLNADQRNALEASADFQREKTGLAKGLIIYNTTTDCWETWNGSQWIPGCVQAADATPLAQPDPVGGNVCGGSTWNFPLETATNGGSGDISYQWQSSPDNSVWTNIPGATNADYTTPPLTGNMYYRRIAGRNGKTVTSNSAQVKVNPPLPAQPGAMTLSANAVAVNGTFTASVPPVPGATGYVWTLPSDGGLAAVSPVSLTTTSPTLTITGSSPFNAIYTTYPAGSITVRAVNACGQSATSASTSCVTVYTGCGAYVDDCTWNVFMCYNLGSILYDNPYPDDSYINRNMGDPFTPGWQNNGAYYEWGRYDPAASAPDNSGAEAMSIAWNTAYPTGWFGSNGTTDPGPDDPTKSFDDPCPAGFRVPNYNEWNGVISNPLNKVSFVGDWTTVANATTNWAGVRLGPALMLPAAGVRLNPAGALSNRGNMGQYWTSRFMNVAGGVNSRGAYYLRFYNQQNPTEIPDRFDVGASIRCIAANTCLPPAAPGAIIITPATKILSSADRIVNLTGTFTASASPVMGATSYQWTLPAGLSGSSTTNSITITGVTGGRYDAGTIKVNAINNCGTGPDKVSTTDVTVGCGAYIAPGVWKEFMCFNLGATENADPFTPVASIHGAKYKWGTGLVALTQIQDQTSAAVVSNWTNVGGVPPTSTEDWDMQNANPCPAGYRVPTKAECDGVANTALNPATFQGTWTNSASNYSSGVKIGTALFLPAPGQRYRLDGSLNYRGSNGYFWTGTNGGPSGTSGFYMTCNMDGSSKVITTNAYRDYGFSVRCVAQ